VEKGAAGGRSGTNLDDFCTLSRRSLEQKRAKSSNRAEMICWRRSSGGISAAYVAMLLLFVIIICLSQTHGSPTRIDLVPGAGADGERRHRELRRAAARQLGLCDCPFDCLKEDGIRFHNVRLTGERRPLGVQLGGGGEVRRDKSEWRERLFLPLACRSRSGERAGFRPEERRRERTERSRGHSRARG